jgi:RNA polymerase sigma-70 factor (ECF subfamily)
MAGVGVRELIDAHYEALYRYGCRLSGSNADGEDLTQETFRKAIARIDQLRQPERARAWLFRILRNAYLHRVRDEKRQRLVPLDGLAELPDGNGEPAEPVDPAALQAALDDLDEAFRTPLILYYFEDFSYRDIAEQMDLPIGTVMSRLARAKAHLRTRLQPEPR